MAAKGVHKITADFEAELCRYTGAPFTIAVDNASNALFLALYYEHYVQDWNEISKYVHIPAHSYPSVPCEIIHAGFKVKFIHDTEALQKRLPDTNSAYLTGAYQIAPTKVWDSALSFHHNMYKPGTHMCLSFTGPYKHLKLGKGGAILTDDEEFYKWAKKARFSGREECSYHVDDFDEYPVVGWNYYMMPEIAARGLLLIAQFWDVQGNPISHPDLSLPYPDLSKFKIYQ